MNAILWIIWSIISAALLIFSVIQVCWLVMHYKKRFITPYRMLCLGVLASIFFFVFPIYFLEFGFESASVLESILGSIYTHFISFAVSLHHAIKLFVLDGSVKELTDALTEIGNVPSFAYYVYLFFGSALYATAPILTFGLILSMFKNIFSQVKYTFSSGKEIHIFSELNEKALALAQSIKKHDPNHVIVFTDVLDEDGEKHYDLVEAAKELNAILFRKDLNSLKLSNCKHSVYLTSEDESENIKHAKGIIKDYSTRPAEKMKLYIFSDREESKCFLDSYSNSVKEEMTMRVERINDIRFLIYRYLDDHGIEFFKSAKPKDDGTREISVAVVGLGRYGLEMVKALLWFCQMPGYKIKITVFDKDINTKSRMKALFPELEFGSDQNPIGDMKYRIDPIGGIDVGTLEFQDALDKISGDLTHIFVALGKDSENLAASLSIRRFLAQRSCIPDLTTVIYDSDLKEHLNYPWDENEKNNIENSSMAEYKLHIIGDVRNFYSIESVIHSSLVDVDGKQLNDNWVMSIKNWGHETKEIVLNQKSFYMHDYNFYSSVSRGLHLHLRKKIVEDKVDIENVFPKLSFNNEISNARGKEYWRYFIISKTTTATDAFFLKEGLGALLSNLSKNADINKLLDEKLEDTNILSLTKRYNGEKFKLDINNDHSYELSIEDVLNLFEAAAEIEHIRWNAYMRTEGFVKGENKQKTKKEHRIHQMLIPVQELSLRDCIQDV